jgi:hypothetical protein
MYSIKIMSGENLADSDVGKGFKMVLVDEGDHFEFGHNAQGEPIVTVNAGKGDNRNGVVYPVTGNAYVMSETGKTVASFWARKKQTVHVVMDENDPDPLFTAELIQSVVRDSAINDHTDVTLFTPDQRCKIYRSRVAQRMTDGATHEEAMTKEARWLI